VAKAGSADRRLDIMTQAFADDGSRKKITEPRLLGGYVKLSFEGWLKKYPQPTDRARVPSDDAPEAEHSAVAAALLQLPEVAVKFDPKDADRLADSLTRAYGEDLALILNTILENETLVKATNNAKDLASCLRKCIDEPFVTWRTDWLEPAFEEVRSGPCRAFSFSPNLSEEDRAWLTRIYRKLGGDKFAIGDP
jgi:hypothetical protein